MAVSEEKKELQDEYRELYGKNPAPMWNEDKLRELIELKQTPSEQDLFVINPKKIYEFRLQGAYKTRNRQQIQPETNAWCEKTKQRRVLRLCQYEESPWKDEQSEGAKTYDRPLTFVKGVLRVDGRDAFKIRHLINCDQIAGKAVVLQENLKYKDVFYLRDEEKENEASLDQELQAIDAKIVARTANLSDLENFLRSKFGALSVLDKNESQIRVFAITKAGENPALFNKDFNNPKHKIKATFQKAKEKNLIKEVDGTVVNKTGATVYRFDAGRHSFDEALARWILEDKDKAAKEFLSDIEGQL
jgi:hypothetical protein